MPDALEFDPNRRLEFDPNRGLEFAPNRPLEFDPRRPLEFQPNRDLGFGHRGVVFRGYVCPVCGSLTTETAVKCSECGANFVGTPIGVGPSPPRAGSGPARPAPSRPPSAAPAPAPMRQPVRAVVAPSERRTTSCTACGARLWENDAFCWNCGAQIASGAATTGLRRER